MGGCKSKHQDDAGGCEEKRRNTKKDSDQKKTKKKEGDSPRQTNQHGGGSPNKKDDDDGEGKENKHNNNHHRTTQGKGTGKGRGGSLVSDLEDEKKAISDNVRGGQFLDYYSVGQEIGRGGYSTVYEVMSKASNKRFAVKCIEKKIMEKGRNIKLLRREIDNMLHVNHPNVLKLKEIFEDDKWFYMVMEFMRGGELFEKIVQRGSYCERDAAFIFKQIVSGVEYLHNKGIAHRDLKPENILSGDDDDGCQTIKIADFGFSKAFDESTLRTSCGSPNYVAPEILTEDHYDKGVDIWSLGVILYIMLCGYPPFYATTNPELFKKIIACRYDFADKRWQNISDSAKDLIQKLLVKDPAGRLTAEQILAHPWLDVAEPSDGQSSSIDLLKLAEYNQQRKEDKAELRKSAPI